MNKVVLSAGVLILAGGAYGANSYLISKAAQQVPVQTQRAITQAQQQNMHVELVNNSVDGKHITQEFAVYILASDGSRSDKPLYISHNADIGWFGLNIKGQVTLPKDKGLAEDIVKDLTPFTEDIHYTYTLASQEIDLNSSLNLEPVTFEPEKGGYAGNFEMGTIHFSMQGSEEDNRGSFKIDSMSFHKDDTDVIDSTFSFNNAVLIFSNNDKKRTSDLSIDSLDYSEKSVYTDDSYHIDNVKLISDMTLNKDLADIKTDFRITSMDLKTLGLELTKIKAGFNSEIDGIDISKVEEINKALTDQDEEKLIQLISSFFENGIKIKDINLYLNDSMISGFIDLNAADYSHATMPYDIGVIAGQNLTSELDIQLTKQLLVELNIPVEFVAPVLTEQYRFKEEDKKFSARVKLDKNQLSINGEILY